MKPYGDSQGDMSLGPLRGGGGVGVEGKRQVTPCARRQEFERGTLGCVVGEKGAEEGVNSLTLLLLLLIMQFIRV